MDGKAWAKAPVFTSERPVAVICGDEVRSALVASLLARAGRDETGHRPASHSGSLLESHRLSMSSSAGVPSCGTCWIVGGVLLVAAGVLVLVGYSLVDGEFYTTSTLVFVGLAMAAPPVAAGILQIECSRGTWRWRSEDCGRS